jgi:putative ABC transport system substrate-binding protein
VIVTGGLPATQAAKEATTTIPIVFSTGVDPIASGLVASLNRPGGNLTGGTFLAAELGPKRLQMLRELIPDAGVFGYLGDPAHPAEPSITADLEVAARMLGVQLIVANGRSDLKTAFATFSQQRVGGVLIAGSSVFYGRTEQLLALAAHHALPAMYPYRSYPQAGGLMSYDSTDDTPHLVGTYAGRILKGDKPADMPIQQAVRVELTLNLKTAKALGIVFPTGLLVRAENVIE